MLAYVKEFVTVGGWVCLALVVLYLLYALINVPFEKMRLRRKQKKINEQLDKAIEKYSEALVKVIFEKEPKKETKKATKKAVKKEDK